MGADLLSPILQQIVDGALKRYGGSPAGLCGQPLVIADQQWYVIRPEPSGVLDDTNRRARSSDECFDQLGNRQTFPRTDVVRLARPGAIHHGDISPHRVAHIRQVPLWLEIPHGDDRVLPASFDERNLLRDAGCALSTSGAM